MNKGKITTYSSSTSLWHPTLETTVLVNLAALWCATSIFFADALLYHRCLKAAIGTWNERPDKAILLQCSLAKAIGAASE